VTGPADLDGARLDHLDVAAYTVPTDAPESDGTLEWDATTVVVCHARSGDVVGMGHTFSAAAGAALVEDVLGPLVVGRPAADVAGAWRAMAVGTRNLGRPGIVASAMACVDLALWDLKARLLGVATASLLGRVRDAVPAYGSGGFTSYDDRRLREQLGGWAADGFRMVKMKVGRDAAADLQRVRAARAAIGETVELFVDANGAYSRKQAGWQAERFAEERVTWFEEPVSSDDLEGLRLVRDRGPAGMDVAAGEYGYDLPYFRRMLDAGAVDVLQADVTRCAGITGFLGVGALCEARSLPLSAHCAPAASYHVGTCIPTMRHVEWFHDHVRLGHMLFEGYPEPVDGLLTPDLSTPGSGLTLKEADAAPYRVR